MCNDNLMSPHRTTLVLKCPLVMYILSSMQLVNECSSIPTMSKVIMHGDVGYSVRPSPQPEPKSHRTRDRREINTMFHITSNKSIHFNIPKQILPTFHDHKSNIKSFTYPFFFHFLYSAITSLADHFQSILKDLNWAP